MGEYGRVEIVARYERGRTRLVRCASSGLLAARSTPWGVMLVAQAAHVVGDDRVEVELDVGPGARLSVGSIGATLARRGSRSTGDPAVTNVRVRVGESASLSWRPEPGIAGGGCLHRSESELALDEGAELDWREEVVLGRSGEAPSGTWWSSLHCRYGDRPLLASEVGLGPAAAAWHAPSVLAAARAYCCLFLAGPRVVPGIGAARSIRFGEDRGAALVLAGPGIEVVAAGSTLSGCRRLVAVLAGDFG